MDEHLQTLEHAQNTAIDLTIQVGSKQVSTDDYHDTTSAITQAVLGTVRARGICMPFSQRVACLPSAA